MGLGTGRGGCDLRGPCAPGQGDEAGEGRGPVTGGHECQVEDRSQLVSHGTFCLDVLGVQEGPRRGGSKRRLQASRGVRSRCERALGPGWALLSCGTADPRRPGQAFPALSLGLPFALPQPVAFPFTILSVSAPHMLYSLPSFCSGERTWSPFTLGCKGLTTAQSEPCRGICPL